jgi:hypothetical protein
LKWQVVARPEVNNEVIEIAAGVIHTKTFGGAIQKPFRTELSMK